MVLLGGRDGVEEFDEGEEHDPLIMSLTPEYKENEDFFDSSSCNGKCSCARLVVRNINLTKELFSFLYKNIQS